MDSSDLDVAATIAKLEHLANVPAGSLASHLRHLWPPGAATEAARRLEAHRKEIVSRGGHRPRPHSVAAKADSLVARVHEYLRDHPRANKSRAFDALADELSVDPRTVSNYYYAHRNETASMHTAAAAVLENA
jgi:hypothetical protein